MAARTRKVKHDWRFYVYALIGADGAPAYIGKGSGRRLAVQERRYGLAGHEVARFHREADAYRFEREAIAEHGPRINRHPGGNGSWCLPRREPFMRVISRREVAGFLLARAAHLIDPSAAQALRAII